MALPEGWSNSGRGFEDKVVQGDFSKPYENRDVLVERATDGSS